MLTIHNLEVQFDVEGDDDAVFTRMFADHIRRWSQRQEEERCRLRELQQERRLDEGTGEQSW